MAKDLSPDDLKTVLACSEVSSLEGALAHLVDCPRCLARLSRSGPASSEGAGEGPPARLLAFGRPGEPADFPSPSPPATGPTSGARPEPGSTEEPRTPCRSAGRRASIDGWREPPHPLAEPTAGDDPPTPPGTDPGSEADPDGGDMIGWLLRQRARCVADEERAPTLMGELLAQPSERRRVLLRNEARFHSHPLAVLLLEESHRQVLDDPRQAEDLARLALTISQRMDLGLRSERLGLDLQARSWSVLANALRVQGNLERAAKAFERSAELLRGSFDPLEKARYLDFLSTLRRDQRRVEESLELCQRALDLYLSVGETGGAARVLSRRGSLLTDWGETSQALEPLRRALELSDALGDAEAEEPYTALVIRHNLAYCQVKLGRCREARRLFDRCQPLYERIPGGLVHLRRRWLEGLIASAEGSMERAEELLLEVQRSFLQEDLEDDAAMVSLDLAQVYARERRLDELEELSGQLVTIFDSRGFRGEALLALTYLHQAAGRRAAGVRVVRHVASYLCRSRYEPELPFERPSLELRLE